uniref:Transmembrane protein n=1 Tax=Steinernema glaseri TaxID=37863 RepID=A0A1I7Y418_9BILA
MDGNVVCSEEAEPTPKASILSVVMHVLGVIYVFERHIPSRLHVDHFFLKTMHTTSNMVFFVLIAIALLGRVEAQLPTVGFQNASSCHFVMCDIYHTCAMMACHEGDTCYSACCPNCEGGMCSSCRCPYCIMTVPNELPPS